MDRKTAEAILETKVELRKTLKKGSAEYDRVSCQIAAARQSLREQDEMDKWSHSLNRGG